MSHATLSLCVCAKISVVDPHQVRYGRDDEEEAVADDGDDVGRVELHVVRKRKWIAGSVRQKVNWKEIVEKCCWLHDPRDIFVFGQSV